MANPHRGEVELVAGAASYTLVLSWNALCEAEDKIGKTIGEIAAELDSGRWRLKTVRALLWAALRERHPEVDLAEAGRIGSAAGVDVVLAAISRALTAGAASDEGAPAGDPPTAAA